MYMPGRYLDRMIAEEVSEGIPSTRVAIAGFSQVLSHFHTSARPHSSVNIYVHLLEAKRCCTPPDAGSCLITKYALSWWWALQLPKGATVAQLRV